MLIQTMALAFIVFLVVVAGMAVGAIFSGRRLAGTCGGLSAIPGVDKCGVCGRDLRATSGSDCGKQEPTARA